MDLLFPSASAAPHLPGPPVQAPQQPPLAGRQRLLRPAQHRHGTPQRTLLAGIRLRRAPRVVSEGGALSPKRCRSSGAPRGAWVDEGAGLEGHMGSFRAKEIKLRPVVEVWERSKSEVWFLGWLLK